MGTSNTTEQPVRRAPDFLNCASRLSPYRGAFHAGLLFCLGLLFLAFRPPAGAATDARGISSTSRLRQSRRRSR